MNNDLQRINPRPCEVTPCQNIASWAYRGVAVCIEDMQAMSDMNSDNAEAFSPALRPGENTAIDECSLCGSLTSDDELKQNSVLTSDEQGRHMRSQQTCTSCKKALSEVTTDWAHVFTYSEVARALSATEQGKQEPLNL
jgi:hypothetical protein